MIYYLRGRVIAKSTKALVVESSGIGFLVQVSESVFEYADIGSEIELFVAAILRGDTFELYGFDNASEREMFDTLRSMDSVGPRLAFRIISKLGIKGILEAVSKKNPVALEQVEGIGKKTASKILLELVSKFELFKDSIVSGYNEERKVAMEALEKLGLKKEEITRLFSDLDFTKLKTAEEIVSEALKKLSKG
ncbi:MAG: Holliday junction branch migration protein RuvA [Actinobacteria bacterium]|nr:Holliday junction branch migration protein RuvA [Actinomycetota bacterium]